jgi:hypothetical protein
MATVITVTASEFTPVMATTAIGTAITAGGVMVIATAVGTEATPWGVFDSATLAVRRSLKRTPLVEIAQEAEAASDVSTTAGRIHRDDD